MILAVKYNASNEKYPASLMQRMIGNQDRTVSEQER